VRHSHRSPHLLCTARAAALPAVADAKRARDGAQVDLNRVRLRSYRHATEIGIQRLHPGTSVHTRARTLARAVARTFLDANRRPVSGFVNGTSAVEVSEPVVLADRTASATGALVAEFLFVDKDRHLRGVGLLRAQ
jgi:N-formylglutamate amidohydrolase